MSPRDPRLILGFLAAAGISADAGANDGTVSYEIADDSFAYVQVFKARGTVGSGFAHDHVVVARRFTGSIRLDPQDLTPCRGHVKTAVASLEVDPRDVREQLGYESLGEDTQRDVRESMLAKDQLWAQRYPTIGFGLTRCRSDRIIGKLRIRGRTRRIDVPATMTVQGSAVAIRAVFEMKHRDFGMEPFSAFLGAVKNDEKLHFVVNFRLVEEG